MDVDTASGCTESAEKIDLRFAPRADHLVLARLVLAGFVATRDLPAAVVHDLKVAITEACTNVVEHAYAGAPHGDATANGREQSVWVSFRIEQDMITVEVSDQGVGFDIEAARTARSKPGNGRGGMGLMIIESLVDTLEITTDSSGSKLTMVKRLSA